MFTCLKGGHLRTNLTNLHNILTHLQKSFVSWQIDSHQKRYLLYMWERIRVTIIISAVLRRILNNYCSLFCKSVCFILSLMNRCWISKEDLWYISRYMGTDLYPTENTHDRISHHLQSSIFAADALYLFCQYAVGWFATLSFSPYSKQSQMFLPLYIHNVLWYYPLYTAFAQNKHFITQPPIFIVS